MVQKALPGVTEGVREPSWGRDGDCPAPRNHNHLMSSLPPQPCLLSLGGCFCLRPKFARRVHNAQRLLSPHRILRSCQVGEPQKFYSPK